MGKRKDVTGQGHRGFKCMLNVLFLMRSGEYTDLYFIVLYIIKAYSVFALNVFLTSTLKIGSTQMMTSCCSPRAFVG